MQPDPEAIRLKLKRVPLFASIDAATLLDLANRCQYRRFEPGSTLVLQEEIPPGLIVILTGEVELQRRLDQGDVLAFARRRAGDVLGEISLLAGGRATASAIAVTAVTTALLLPVEFDRFLHQSPQACRALLKSLAERLRETTDLLVSAHRDSLPQRLADLLLNESDENGFVSFQNQQMLGDRIGGSREAVNRALRKLCDLHAVTPLGKRNHYRINRTRLSSLAGR